MLQQLLLTALFAKTALPLASPATSAALCLDVRDEVGSPLPGAWIRLVELHEATAAGPRTHSGVTGAEGRACLQVLPLSYSVEVSLMGYVNARFYPVKVYAGRARNLRVVLPVGEVTEGPVVPEAAVTGRLLYKQQVLAAARICLHEEKSGSLAACTRTDGLGTFLLLVAPAKYSVVVVDSQEMQYRGKLDADRTGRVEANLDLQRDSIAGSGQSSTSQRAAQLSVRRTGVEQVALPQGGDWPQLRVTRK